MRSYIIIIVCLYAYSGLFDHMPVLHAGVHCVQKQEQELLVPPICRWRSLAYAKEMWVRWSWRCVFVWVNWADGDMMWEAIWTASSTLCTCVCVCVCVCVFCQWRSQNMSVYSVQSAEYAGCWGTSDVHFFINWTILLLLCGLWSNTCSTGPWCYLKLKRVWKCWHEHVQIFSVKITGYKFFWCTFMTLYSKSISLLRWLTTDQRAVVLTAVYNSIYSPCT